MTVSGVAAQLAAVAPVGRDEARRAAERELSKGIYHRGEPGPVTRAFETVIDWIDRFLDRLAAGAPGGSLGALVLLAIVLVVAGVVLWWTGPIRRGARIRQPHVELSGDVGTDEHRRRADEHATAGRFAEAVRERMRAIVRELETRGVPDPRPGRTADEVAREAGAAVPTIAGDLRAAAVTFDEIWYGGRPATPQADALMRQTDDRVRRAPMVLAGRGDPAVAGYQVPR
ncbi:MAG TPA: DUF4129 domain-containing protein [Mycobacteriales bacterium]